jgi:hypothetical protein
MHELAAINTSAHQVADCIGFSHREETLFLQMRERDSSLTYVLVARGTWMKRHLAGNASTKND